MGSVAALDLEACMLRFNSVTISDIESRNTEYDCIMWVKNLFIGIPKSSMLRNSSLC